MTSSPSRVTLPFTISVYFLPKIEAYAIMPFPCQKPGMVRPKAVTVEFEIEGPLAIWLRFARLVLIPTIMPPTLYVFITSNCLRFPKDAPSWTVVTLLSWNCPPYFFLSQQTLHTSSFEAQFMLIVLVKSPSCPRWLNDFCSFRMYFFSLMLQPQIIHRTKLVPLNNVLRFFDTLSIRSILLHDEWTFYASYSQKHLEESTSLFPGSLQDSRHISGI